MCILYGRCDIKCECAHDLNMNNWYMWFDITNTYTLYVILGIGIYYRYIQIYKILE